VNSVKEQMKGKNKDLHYWKTKKFFQKQANRKKGFYTSRDNDNIKKEIKKRKMWQIYTYCLKEVLDDNPDIQSGIDVGCGMGNFLLEMIQFDQLEKIIGLDFLKETIDLALENPELMKKVTFIQGDLLDMPFNNRDFDLTVCLNVLHHIHIDDLNKAIEELTRITNKCIILEIRNNKYVFNLFYSPIILSKVYRKLPLYSTNVSEVTSLMNARGFHLKKIRGKHNKNWACRRLVLVYERTR